jgi:mono/diheme cytochrome c family protein
MKMQLLALAVVVAVSGCAKGNDSTTASNAGSTQPAASAAVAQNDAQSNGGGKVYQTNCSSCHQATGAGVPETFPPLANNPTVVGDPTNVIHIVKYGLTGKLTVMGMNYNGMMPNWGQSMSNADIAAAITYIRSSWGNKAGAVTEADVAAVAK